jgi:hypothetical protein
MEGTAVVHFLVGVTLGIFLFTTRFRQALEPTQPPIPPYIFMTWRLIKQEIHLHGMVLS